MTFNINNLDPVKLTQLLVQRPSVTPDDQGCQEFLKGILETVGFKCSWVNRNGVTNLWATHTQHQDPNSALLPQPVFCFAGHTDVVPVGDETLWKYPPFSGEIITWDDGQEYVWGRGSEDMKSGVASSITAAIKYIQQYPDHPGTIAFIITSDEEAIAIDGTDAVVQYLEQLGQKIDYCLVAEPSSKKQLGDCVSIGRRGSLTLKATITGKQGHVAYPANVVNPIHQLGEILHKISNYQLDQGNQDFPASSIQFVELQAGVGADNVVPATANFILNVRYNNLHTEESLKAILLDLINSFGYQVDLQWVAPGNPFLSPKGKLVDTAHKYIKQHLGVTPTNFTGGGTSDARFIIRIASEIIELGISSITLHQTNERAPVKEIQAMEKIYLDILTETIA